MVALSQLESVIERQTENLFNLCHPIGFAPAALRDCIQQSRFSTPFTVLSDRAALS
jgi:hypothetical protein